MTLFRLHRKTDSRCLGQPNVANKICQRPIVSLKTIIVRTPNCRHKNAKNVFHIEMLNIIYDGMETHTSYCSKPTIKRTSPII